MDARISARQNTMSQHANAAGPLVDALEICQTSNAESGGCKLLDILGLAYSTEINSLVCKNHGILLPLDGIVPHLDRKHNWGFRASKLSPNHVLQHLRDTHGDTICQSSGTSFPPDALERQLEIDAELMSIRFRYCCPQPQCNMWVARNDSYAGCPETELYSHLSKVHNQKVHPKDVKGSWCQKVILYTPFRATKKTHIFQLPSYVPTEHPLNPSFSTKTYHTPLTSTWFRDLKWPEFQMSLQNIPFDTLQRLVAPPSQQLVHSSAEKVTKHIESGLLLVRKELTEYLKNGQQFIASIHGSYRISLRPRYDRYLAIYFLAGTNYIFQRRKKSSLFSYHRGRKHSALPWSSS